MSGTYRQALPSLASHSMTKIPHSRIAGLSQLSDGCGGPRIICEKKSHSGWTSAGGGLVEIELNLSARPKHVHRGIKTQEQLLEFTASFNSARFQYEESRCIMLCIKFLYSKTCSCSNASQHEWPSIDQNSFRTGSRHAGHKFRTATAATAPDHMQMLHSRNTGGSAS